MRLQDSSGGTNYTVPFSNGALCPDHIGKIGPAFPVFMAYEDMVTTGEGEDGLVYGGSPVTDKQIARRLGLSRKTVSRHRKRLQEFRYIEALFVGRGFRIRVRGSKKWVAIRAAQGGQKYAPRADKTVHPGVTNLTTQMPSILNDKARTIQRPKAGPNRFYGVGRKATEVKV